MKKLFLVITCTTLLCACKNENKESQGAAESEQKEEKNYFYADVDVQAAQKDDFAVAIFKLKGVTIPVHSIQTNQFPTPAKRPAYSVLDKSKIKKVMQLTIPQWQDSLRELLT